MADQWIWDRYWQFDRVASCMDGAGASNYAEEVASGWRAFFEAVPAGAVVLDLCTGNGAIALLAAEVDRRNADRMTIVGVDKAEIDPARYVSKFRADLGAIDFRGGVDVERLPFPDDSASAVVSQYGIEYSDMARSIPEAVRVLAPGGRVRFVVHAAEGAIAAGAAKTVEDADFLLDGIDLPGSAARCLRAVLAVERDPAASAASKSVAEESVRQFQDALTANARRVASAMDKAMMRNAGSVLADTFSKRGYFQLPQLLEKVDEVRTEVKAHRGRSLALVNSALGEDEVGAACAQLGSAGVKATYGPLSKNGRLIGYIIEGSK